MSIAASTDRGEVGKKYVQVLQIPSGERNVGDDLNLAIAGLGDLDGVAEVADAALDLDLIVQELLEGGNVEDLVVGWLGAVDDVLLQIFMWRLEVKEREESLFKLAFVHTFFVTF